MTWLIHHGPRELAGSDLVVGIVLAEHTNPENGVAYPSVKRIATMARLSERQVTRVLADLVRRGILAVAWEATNRRPKGYFFPGFRGDTYVTPSQQPGVTSEAAPGVTPMSPKRNDVERSSPPAPPPGGEPPRTKSKPRTAIPAGWQVSEAGRTYALEHGIRGGDVEDLVRRFKNHHEAHGTVMRSWDAGWRTWVDKEPRFGANGRVTAADHNAAKRGKLVV